MQGDLMVTSRENFHKVYDLTERVLPTDTDTSLPSPEEYARFLITRYLQANGLGQSSEIAYLLKDTKSLISTALKDMTSSGELVQVRVGGNLYHALPNAQELLNKPLARGKLKILSPFDNLVIQRKRMQALFGFDYLIECYVPAGKRRYGYFSLPILWDGKLVARMDCKSERKTSVLHIHHLALEPGLSKLDTFFFALRKELEAFLHFNQCGRVKLHRTSPGKVALALRAAINELSY